MEQDFTGEPVIEDPLFLAYNSLVKAGSWSQHLETPFPTVILGGKIHSIKEEAMVAWQKLQDGCYGPLKQLKAVADALASELCADYNSLTTDYNGGKTKWCGDHMRELSAVLEECWVEQGSMACFHKNGAYMYPPLLRLLHALPHSGYAPDHCPSASDQCLADNVADIFAFPMCSEL